MAKPFFLFENLFEDGTLAATTTDTGFDVEAVDDWRPSTQYRHRMANTSSTAGIWVDMGASFASLPHAGKANTVVIAGHNLSDACSADGWRLQWSDDGVAYTSLFGYQLPTDNGPQVMTFTTPASGHRYWRLLMSNSGPFAAKPEMGMITVGRRLEFELGNAPRFDPYGGELVEDQSRTTRGVVLGTNVRYIRKRIFLDYIDDRAMSTSGFYATSGMDWDDYFVPHWRTGKPWWFSWDDDQKSEVFLCKAPTFQNPLRDNYNWRELSMELETWQEVA